MIKTRFIRFGIIAAVVIGVSACFVGCNTEMNDVVNYHGQVVYINTTTPFPDLIVKVTNGQYTHCQTQTDAGGMFSLKVRVSEIDGSYYLLAGDSTCVPKKVSLGSYGQAEVDMGVIEVEGPALPTVITTPLQSVKADEAILGGEVQTDGRTTVTARGVCYGTDPYPSISGLHTTDGTGLGTFTSSLVNLECNTIYYVRAYATNKMGTAYGEQVKFTTEEGVAIVVTDSVIRITAHSAKCIGHVESDGGFPVTKRGTCWSKRPDPTIFDDCTEDGSGKGDFVSTIKDLFENTTYYVRTYATNSTKTSYGEQVVVTTLDGLAVVKTDSITAVTATGFSAYGTVVSDCDIPVTARGFCYSTSQYPTIENEHTIVGKGIGKYQSNITNLQVGTTYYVRAYATNETATTYGEQIMVTTLDGLPIVEIVETNSTAKTISVACEVTETGGFSVIERGICYSTENTKPTIEDIKVISGKGIGIYNATISEAQAATKYYVRAYATNINGTSYSEVVQIQTKDGNAIISLGEITNITALTASASVIITDNGSATLQSCGICWSTNPNPTITDSKTAATGKALNIAYPCNMSELQPETTYYVRGYAITDVTTTYSQQQTFTTTSGLPQLTTVQPSATSTNISSGGNITSDGGYAITARGICYSISNSEPTLSDAYTMNGTGSGAFSSVITSVYVSTTYYVRAYATNRIGTGYGNVIVVTTGNGLPSVVTTVVGENVTETTAVSGGNVTDDGGYIVTARGVCWSTLPYPTVADSKTIDGSGTGYYSSSITAIDLTGSNIYYVRAYATNQNGTTYGEQVLVSKENMDYKNLPTIEYGGYTYRIYPDMGAMSWDMAMASCDNLTYGGYSDWFLPTKDELTHIMKTYTIGWQYSSGSDFEPKLNGYPTSLTGVISAWYWTSTPYNTNSYYCVRYEPVTTYKHGVVSDAGSKEKTRHVRPVRKYLANQ